MNSAARLRHYFVDGEQSLGERSRQRRWTEFVDIFPDLGSMRVLDLGGTARFWLRSPVRPAHVHLVNVALSPESLPDWIVESMADACELPGSIRDQQFDLVYSNSVIEHVGGHYRREQFAETVRSCAPVHWVQTPYRYFPIEPHWVAPGLQFLPLWLRARIAMRWPLAHSRTADVDVAVRTQLNTELIGVAALRHYFPDSEIRRERLGGVTKSLIAVRK